MTRRLIICFALLFMVPIGISSAEPLELDSRRELMVDNYLIKEMKAVQLKLNPLQPAPRSKKPAIGLRGLVGGHYATVLMDGDTYHQYCRGAIVKGAYWKTVGKDVAPLNEVTLYAKSQDGINWVEPELNFYDLKKIDQRLLDFAKKKNVPVKNSANIVLAHENWVNHNFSPFIDLKPGVPANERYKGVGGGHGRGLLVYASPDGLHWKRLKDKAVIPAKWGKHDSQNVAFYSVAEKQYVCYFRAFDKNRRVVKRTTSKDFINWTEPVLMKGRMQKEQFYTSGTRPYFRAPHIYIAPATLYLPGQRNNTRIILMTSRAGSDTYDRTFGQENFLPDPAVGDRTNYIAYGNGVQTGPKEMSFYNLGKRYTLRLEGFGSVNAGAAEGEMITKPLTFKGSKLELNFKTADGGSIRVEIQSPDGKPLSSFGLNECNELTGDAIEKTVKWKAGTDLSKFSGKPVRLRFVMKNADLYALRFKEKPTKAKAQLSKEKAE